MKERLFLILAFFISWGIELVLFLTGHVNDTIYNLVSPLIAFGPALAVIITKYVIKEPLGINLWFKPEGRKTGRYIILGWFGPVLLIAIGVIVYFVIFQNQFDGGMQAMIESIRGDGNNVKDLTDADIRQTLWLNIGLNVIMAPYYNVFTCVPEEFAWRGYFLNALCERYSKWKAVLLNGVVWGIWYIPLMALNLFYGREFDGNMVMSVVYVLAYSMAYTLVFNLIYSFLTIKTHTCIPAILANACVASVGIAGRLFLKNPNQMNLYLNPTNTSVIGGIGFIFAAAVIFYFLKKERIQPEAMRPEVAAYNESVKRKKEQQRRR